MRISLRGDAIAKLVSASSLSLGSFKADRLYDFVRIHLIKIGCPRELMAAKENTLNMPLVVERNRGKLGFVKATGYFPPSVVVAGAYRRDHLLTRGILNSWGWVERGALESTPEDTLSCAELMEGLTSALTLHCFGGQEKLMHGQSWPCISAIYPFDGMIEYTFSGRSQRHRYSVDSSARGIELESMSVVDACNMGMGPVQTGVRQVTNPLPLATNQVISRGGILSDLVTQVVRDNGNVQDVVSKMLVAMKTGLYKPLKPDFAPVNLSDDGKILGPLVEAGIAPVDFIRYVDLHAREFSDGERKSLAKNGYAMPDGSFPIKSVGDLHNAVHAFGRSPDEPTKRHIIKRAHALRATHLLPGKWGVKKRDINSFGRFHSHKTHDVGSQKNVAFKV